MDGKNITSKKIVSVRDGLNSTHTTEIYIIPYVMTHKKKDSTANFEFWEVHNQ